MIDISIFEGIKAPKLIVKDNLYRKNSNDEILIWRMEILDDSYRTVSGRLDGKQVTSKWKRAEEKNVGRSNATTPQEQAELEVEAQYKKKLESNYYDNIDNIGSAKFFEPMLAEKYSDKLYEQKLKNNNRNQSGVSCLISPKLDGMRAIFKDGKLYTRTGKEIQNLLSLKKSLSALSSYLTPFAMHGPPKIVLDGELYNHTHKNKFEKLMSLINKKNATQEELDEADSVVQFHIYDICVENISMSIGVGFDAKTRRDDYAYAYNKLKPEDKQRIVITESISFQDSDSSRLKDKIKEIHDDFVRRGYEGAMIRMNTPYENGRTQNLMKYKEFVDDEFELLDILEGRGNWSGKAKKGVFRSKYNPSDTFEATFKGTMQENEIILKEKDKYIGSMCTVTYQKLSGYGVPIFGTIKELNRTDNI